MNESLEVWLDCDLWPMQRLGTLAHDRGQVRFNYDKAWLTQQDIAFAIDPQLSLDAGPFFPRPEAGNRPSLNMVLATAAFYRLAPKRAREVIDEVVTVVGDWQAVARRAGISSADIEQSTSAFKVHVE